MGSRKPDRVEWRGEHEYFEHGKSYTYAQYAGWTMEQNMDDGVNLSTMKGRLGQVPFAEAKHLLSVADYKALSNQRGMTLCGKVKREASSTRFESANEVRSQEWLSRKL